MASSSTAASLVAATTAILIRMATSNRASSSTIPVPTSTTRISSPVSSSPYLKNTPKGSRSIIIISALARCWKIRRLSSIWSNERERNRRICSPRNRSNTSAPNAKPMLNTGSRQPISYGPISSKTIKNRRNRKFRKTVYLKHSASNLTTSNSKKGGCHMLFNVTASFFISPYFTL